MKKGASKYPILGVKMGGVTKNTHSRSFIKNFLSTQKQQTAYQSKLIRCMGNLHTFLQLHKFEDTRCNFLLQVLHIFHFELYFNLLNEAKAFCKTFETVLAKLESTIGR